MPGFEVQVSSERQTDTETLLYRAQSSLQTGGERQVPGLRGRFEVEPGAKGLSHLTIRIGRLQSDGVGGGVLDVE